jgi:hypothetical protein
MTNVRFLTAMGMGIVSMANVLVYVATWESSVKRVSSSISHL